MQKKPKTHQMHILMEMRLKYHQLLSDIHPHKQNKIYKNIENKMENKNSGIFVHSKCHY
jgi:hypothetical protein